MEFKLCKGDWWFKKNTARSFFCLWKIWLCKILLSFASGRRPLEFQGGFQGVPASQSEQATTIAFLFFNDFYFFSHFIISRVVDYPLTFHLCPNTTATFNEFHRNSCPAIRGPGGRAACAAKIGGNPYSPWPETWFPQWASGGRKGKSFPKRAEAPAFAKKRLLPYFGKQDALSPGPGKSFQNHKRLWKS